VLHAMAKPYGSGGSAWSMRIAGAFALVLAFILLVIYGRGS
jgi:hypothetical protein